MDGNEVRRLHLPDEALARLKVAHSKASLDAVHKEEPCGPPFLHPGIPALVAEANRILYRAQQEEADRRLLEAASSARTAERAAVKTETVERMTSRAKEAADKRREKAEASLQAVMAAATRHLRLNPDATLEQIAAALEPIIGLSASRIGTLLKGRIKTRRARKNKST